jgi:hypothetical protein
MSRMPSQIRGPRGRRRAWDMWPEDQLTALRALCQRNASWDDLNAAFPEYGMSSIMYGMRTIIYRDYFAATQPESA